MWRNSKLQHCTGILLFEAIVSPSKTLLHNRLQEVGEPKKSVIMSVAATWRSQIVSQSHVRGQCERPTLALLPTRLVHPSQAVSLQPDYRTEHLPQGTALLQLREVVVAHELGTRDSYLVVSCGSIWDGQDYL